MPCSRQSFTVDLTLVVKKESSLSSAWIASLKADAKHESWIQAEKKPAQQEVKDAPELVTLRVTSPLWLWGPEELEVQKEYRPSLEDLKSSNLEKSCKETSVSFISRSCWSWSKAFSRSQDTTSLKQQPVRWLPSKPPSKGKLWPSISRA